MNTVHNERIKLLANAVNTLALAVVVAGFIAPGINGQLHGAGSVITIMAWIGIGAGLHCSAQIVLGRLRE